MMVHPLRLQRDARHEAPGLVEALELEAALDGIAALDLAPPAELGERRPAGIPGQLFGHGILLPSFDTPRPALARSAAQGYRAGMDRDRNAPSTADIAQLCESSLPATHPPCAPPAPTT